MSTRANDPSSGPFPSGTVRSATGASHAVTVQGAGMVFNEGRSNAVEALTGIDLTIDAGEFVSLIGPSGCGKSTLLRLIANLLEPTTGNVLVNGKSAAQARDDQAYAIAIRQPGPSHSPPVVRKHKPPRDR